MTFYVLQRNTQEENCNQKMKKRKIRNPRETILQEKIKKVKAVGMKDSGLKLQAEATVLHPIESEVEKIQ